MTWLFTIDSPEQNGKRSAVMCTRAVSDDDVDTSPANEHIEAIGGRICDEVDTVPTPPLRVLSPAIITTAAVCGACAAILIWSVSDYRRAQQERLAAIERSVESVTDELRLLRKDQIDRFNIVNYKFDNVFEHFKEVSRGLVTSMQGSNLSDPFVSEAIDVSLVPKPGNLPEKSGPPLFDGNP